jgi:hypothetical protein
MIEPIRKSLVVEATAERAFRVFTEEHGAWWPLATHHIGKQAAETAVIEPRAGGRWFERATDGTICLWGSRPGVGAAEPAGAALADHVGLELRRQLLDRDRSTLRHARTGANPDRVRASAARTLRRARRRAAPIDGRRLGQDSRFVCGARKGGVSLFKPSARPPITTAERTSARCAKCPLTTLDAPVQKKEAANSGGLLENQFRPLGLSNMGGSRFRAGRARCASSS